MKPDLKLIADESRHWAFDAAEALRPIIAAQNGIPEFGDTGQRHLIYMLDTMQREPMSATKACRWLGWIQAALVANGAQCLADMKAHNKRFSDEAQRVGTGVVADGWRPIESAPMDGRCVLLSYANSLGKRRTVRASWETEDAIGEWENGDECTPGWYERSEEHEEMTEAIYRISETPTHWHALPHYRAPTQEGGGNV